MSAGTQFVSITLNGESTSHSFDPDIEIGDIDTVMSKSGLIVKQIILGHDAAVGEINVIQVDTAGVNGAACKAPIAILEAGKNWQSICDFTFPDSPVNFTLVKGKGPVYIQGNTFQLEVDEDNPDGEEEDDEELSEGEQEQLRIMQEEAVKRLAKKRKTAETPDDESAPKKNGKAAAVVGGPKGKSPVAKK